MDKLADSGTDDDEMEIDEDESEDDGADIMQWAYVGAVSGCWRTLIKKSLNQVLVCLGNFILIHGL